LVGKISKKEIGAVMKAKTDSIPTISLEEVQEPLDMEPALAKRQIMDYLTTDDLESFGFAEDQIICLFVNTIIDEKRFHKEIASFLPDIVESPENVHITTCTTSERQSHRMRKSTSLVLLNQNSLSSS
jgi:hypothetical protein